MSNCPHDQFNTANDLLQAGLRGELSRRDLIVHAAKLGLGAGVTGIILSAIGEDALAADPVTDGKKTKPTGPEIDDGQIVVGVVGSIDTLNPYVTNLNAQGFDVLAGVMDGLVGFDSRQRLKPVLAESYTISDDGLIYTFKLRPNVLFSNGEALTSKDIVATWQMVMNPDLPVWSRLGWDKITSIETPDDLTAVVNTASIFAPFLSSIAAGQYTTCAIGPSSILNQDLATFRTQFDRKPIGTGPFRIKSVGKREVILERYTKHWAGTPRLDLITVRIFDTFEEQLTALEAGEIQIASRTGSPGKPRLTESTAIDDAVVLQYPGLTWGHLDLKNVGFLTQTEVRQALDFATPRADIIAEVLGGAGDPGAADQAPGSWAFSQRIDARDLDIGQATDLLEKAGFDRGESGQFRKDGRALEIDLWGEEGDDQAAAVLRLVADSWSRAGISSRINLAQADELWGSTGYQFNDRETAGFYRWSNVNDPDDMFYWHSSQIPVYPGGTRRKFTGLLQ